MPVSLSTRAREHAITHPLALIVASTVLYATGPTLVQASDVSGPVFSFWRLWMGVPILLGAALVGGGVRRWRSLDLRAWRWPVAAGLFFGLHQLAFMTAVKLTSVTDATLVNTLAPLMVALAAIPLFGERPTVRFWLSTLVAMSGTAIVVLGGSSGASGNVLGMALALLNVVFFTGFFLVSKRSRDDIDVLSFLAGVITVAAVVVSVWVLATGADAGTVEPLDLWLALAVAAGPGALGHALATWPLAYLPAGLPPVIRLGQPIIAGLIAWAVLGEPVTVAHLVGGALTLAGVLGAVTGATVQEAT